MTIDESDFVRALIEASPDAIYRKDVDGIYVAMNPAGARLLGRPVDEILGRDDRALFDEETARRIAAIDRKVISQREPVTYEDTASGSRTLWTTKGPLLAADGSVRGLFGISRDLQRERLAALAYELRTPLGTVANAASVLRRTAVGPAADLLAIMVEEIGRVEAVVSELLDFRPNLPARSPQLMLRLFESSLPVVAPEKD